MTESEKQVIIDAVLTAIRTNSRTIDQLTPVSSLSSTDYFEVSGGRRIAYNVLASLIASMSADDQSNLQTAIDKKELQSVAITTTASDATLTIKSVGKTISCKIPIATSSQSGIITAADKVKLDSAYTTADTASRLASTAQETATQAKTAAGNAQNTANAANSEIALLKPQIANMQGNYSALRTEFDTFKGTKGQPKGIASLDASGKVPSSQLPGYVDDVVEFHSIEENITLQENPSTHKSTDSGCMVVYDAQSNRFILAVSKIAITEEAEWGGVIRPFGGTLVKGDSSLIMPTALELDSSAQVADISVNRYKDFWDINDNGVVVGIKVGSFTYYADWDAENDGLDADTFGTATALGRKPTARKIYTCTSTNNTYRWGQTSLIVIGSDLKLGRTEGTAFPGDAGAILEQEMEYAKRNIYKNSDRLRLIGILPCDGYWNGEGTPPAYGVWLCPNGEDGVGFQSFGDCNFYGIAEEEYNCDLVANSSNLYRTDDGIFRIVNDKLESISGSAVGNCYNITIKRIESNEQNGSGVDATFYDDLESAIEYLIKKGKAALGMQITYAQALKSWKTWQYLGGTTEPEELRDKDNWLDMAGLSAGGEAVVNVNYLCDNPTGEYNLSLAIKALLDKEEETKVNYRKPGLVLIYRSGQGKWESKMFLGTSVNDIKANTPEDSDLWRDLGGGSSNVVAKDEPTDGGTDALSTGGAYKHIPVKLRKDTETPGVVKLALVNAGGEDVGDEVQFSVGTGTGDGGGTLVAINFEQSPFYAQAGGSVVIKASIISSTTVKGNEITNTIETVQLIDRTTKLVLETWRMYKPSSSSERLFDFEFDVSSYFTTAGSRDFQLKVTDDGGNVGTRNITVVAVDLTIQSEQTLNYTSSTSLKVGENKNVTLNCYSFPNFSTDIKAVEEIFIDGEWHTMGTTNVKSSHTNIISVNAMNCCGKVLTHGAYPIRVHGEDEKSGVVGAYLHSTLFVVDSASTEPLIALRWISEEKDARVKMLSDVKVDYAVYLPGANNANAQIWYGVEGQEEQVSNLNVMSSQTYTFTHKVTDVKTDGTQSVCVYAKSSSGNTGTSQVAKFLVDGTLLDISEVAGAVFNHEFASRSNSEGSLDIDDNGVRMIVRGSNMTTNGFVKDSFGSDNYDTDYDDGVMTLRIAENVTAVTEYAPYDDASIETNGMAIQFKARFRNMAKDDALLINCIENGNGFYMTGEKLVVTTDGGETQDHTIEVMLKDDAEQDIIIVYEPTRIAPYAGIGIIRVFVDGDEAGACYYNAGSITRHGKFIEWYGTDGELYLYNCKAWRTYFAFVQAFYSHLLRKRNVTEMIDEYEFNDVMAPTTAEGVTQDRPQADKLESRNIATLTVCKSVDTAGNMDEDQFPPYLETLDGDKKTARLFDWYLRFPTRRWQDCVIYAMEETNQGTTSSWEKIKNIKGKSKNARVVLLHQREEFLGDPYALAMYDECAKNAAKNRIQIYDDSVPTNIICIKVDIQDASGANNGAMMQMMNELQKAMGPDYMTPAQNAYTGKYNLNTSIDSIPIAYFRTDKYSPDATSPSYGYFHCKGNFNQDKGDAKVFGFEDVEGYNLGCLNYGDFIEHVAPRVTADFDSYAASLDKSDWEKQDEDGNDIVHMVSEFCGEKYHFYRFQNGAWRDTTGTMRCTNFGAVKQTGAKPTWLITGDVLNPVENIELRKYDGFCWLQGCNSVDDLLVQGESGPVWLEYFESRYPDDKKLNALYEAGQKVPYHLFELLKWAQECNHNRTEADGTISIKGKVVPGTKANRIKKFCEELYERANVKSVILYKGTIHYCCSADQESKNAMLGWYLDIDGKTRLYMNHMYDGDNQWGLGNNSAYTVPVDVNMDTDIGIYQGYDSVLFKHLTPNQELRLDDDGHTIAVRSVIKDMRECTLSSGVRPFSPAGIEKYWVTDRLSKWPKVVSSFDGERKYVKTATSTYNKIYGLHGLGINRLRQFVQKRFDLCDGYFQVGDIYTSVMKMRATGTDIKIRLTAAKAGYFGVGVDQAASAIDGAYLEAGESIELHSGVSNVAGGMLINIFGADKIGVLDISEATPSQNNWDISQCILLKKLIIGGEGWTGTTNSEGFLKTLNLGNKPFLEEIDIRGTHVTSVNASLCPRIKGIYAGGGELQSITLAETSPIETLQLSDNMTALNLVNLPNLTYPGGLTIGNTSAMSRLVLSGCPKIDPYSVIDTIVSRANITSIRMTDLNITASSEVLKSLKSAKGIDPNGNEYDETNRNSGLTGRWILSDLIDEDEADELNAYFPEMEVHNCQFSIIKVQDDDPDEENKMTNLDNNTGRDFNTPFVQSGHLLAIEENTHSYKCTFNEKLNRMEGEELDDMDFNFLCDGSSIDLTDNAGEGYDIMWHLCHLWYKGVNDFKNQVKYYVWSTTRKEPISTASKCVRKAIAELLYRENAGVYVNDAYVGTDVNDVVATTANMNVYRMDVEGMKQVRWPGINMANIGCVFTDADGKVIDKFKMSVSNAQFDFDGTRGDYIFTDVPAGAKWFFFSTYLVVDKSTECIAVDSSNVEAIEPDWVEHKAAEDEGVECEGDSLIGNYPITMDALKRPRSVSSTGVSQKGTGTSTTGAWEYDADGNPTSIPTSNLNYTMKDFENLAWMRGPGFQLIDYEQHKETAIVWWCCRGRLNEQAVVGNGQHNGRLNQLDNIGMRDSTYNGNNFNSLMGLKAFIGCNNDWMTNIAVNVTSFLDYKKRKGVEYADFPLDHIAHIYDPIDRTERTLKLPDGSGDNVIRLIHGRRCDILPSRVDSGDRSKYVTYYCAGFWYSNSRSRVLLRSSVSASAYSGFAFAYAYYASSSSNTVCGARLAFRGTFVIVKAKARKKSKARA